MTRQFEVTEYLQTAEDVAAYRIAVREDRASQTSHRGSRRHDEDPGRHDETNHAVRQDACHFDHLARSCLVTSAGHFEVDARTPIAWVNPDN